jgi:protoporphyrinogen oxidase/cytochrome b involved in lipid metabolism
MYDYLIVGAGISGLYTAFKLNQSFPDKKICIIESTEYIGGRLHSIKYDGIIVDGGGARFNIEQYRVISLVKELNLIDKLIPISNDIKYISVKPKYDINLETIFPTINSFIKYLQKYIKTNNITEKELINTTILDFVDKKLINEYPTIKQYLTDIYPYYSELGILNALESIKLFTNEFSNKMKYYCFNGGMEQLTEIIYNKLKKLSNIQIYKSSKLDKIIKQSIKTEDTNTNTYYDIICNSTQPISYSTQNLIITIPKNKLLEIDYLTKNKTLFNFINSVQDEPLYRIYARYPLDKTTGKVWFENIGKISTNIPIKYIIPVNPKKGVIMISYTDSKFAEYWSKQLMKDTDTNNNFENTLNKQLKEIFPDINIPKAKWYKHCYWKIGAGYWKSGYDRKDIMNKITKPIDNENLYICGENYSSHQAWVEGSLETSNLVLSKLGIDIKYKNTHPHSHTNTNIHNFSKIKEIIKIKKNKMIHVKLKTKKKISNSKSLHIMSGSSKNKLPEYSLEEIAKHNKKTDAWIVINNKVADITNWIPKHPGGDIIMKGVGKDATLLFNNVGHDNYAKKMLKKYQIGILKK